MLKLLLCLVSAFLIGAATLQLRQQELQLRHRTVDLQQKIQAKQSRLWEQQVIIARETAPNALAGAVVPAAGSAEERWLVPRNSRLPGNVGDWVGSRPAMPGQEERVAAGNGR